jgi:hypothetical protein
MFVDMGVLGSPSHTFTHIEDAGELGLHGGLGLRSAGPGGVGMLPSELIALFGSQGDVFQGGAPQDFLGDGFGPFGRRPGDALNGAGSPTDVLGLVASPS